MFNLDKLKEERSFLKDKLVKINQFSGDISDFQRELLSCQYVAMQAYLGVLNLRIKYLDGVERKNVK